jgi:hypothetical protein
LRISNSDTRSRICAEAERLTGGRRILCGLRLDAAEELSRAAPLGLPLVVLHLSLALAALAVGRQNSPAAREALRRPGQMAAGRTPTIAMSVLTWIPTSHVTRNDALK